MAQSDYHTQTSHLRGLSIANHDSARDAIIDLILYFCRAQSKADYIGPKPAGVSHSRVTYLLELYRVLVYGSLSRDTLEPVLEFSAVIRRSRRDVAKSKPSISGKKYALPKLSSSRSDIASTANMDQMTKLMFSYMILSSTFLVTRCLPSPF